MEARRRGLFVKGLSASDLEELYTLREAIETLALRLAISRAKDSEWDAAERAVATMNQAADAGDPQAFAAADLDFHSELYRLSRHRRLAAVWEQLRPTLAAVFTVAKSHGRDLRKPARMHRQLLVAIRAGDVDKAVELLTKSNRSGLAERAGDLPLA